MDPNDQQPNQKPDYDFITNQSAIDSHPKKVKIKVIVGLVLCLLLSVIMLLLFVNTKIQEASKTEPDITKKFMTLMATNTDQDYKMAVTLMNTTIVEGVSNNIPILQRLSGGIDFSTCKFANQKGGTILYECVSQTISISLSLDQKTGLISAIKVAKK